MDNNQNGYDANTNNGYQNGYDANTNNGYQNGYDANANNGYQNGYDANTNNGYQNSYGANTNNGYQNGYDANMNNGYQNGYNANVGNGYQNGYNANMNNGYSNGSVQNGSYSTNGYNPNQNGNAPTPVPPKKKSRAGLVIGIIIAVLVLAAGCTFAVFSIMRSKEKAASKEAVETYFAEFNNQNFDGAYNTFHPDERENVKKLVLSAAGAADSTEYWEYYEAMFGPMKVTYDITDEKKITKDELDNVLKAANTLYGTSVSVKKAYAYKITETYTGTNGKLVQNETVVVGKEGSDWYIIAASTDEVVSNDLTTTEAVTEDTEETTEATTEATTEEAAEPEQPAAQTNPANGFDMDNLQFAINGKEYSLSNLTYADIMDMGYAVDSSVLTQDVEDNTYTGSQSADGPNDTYFFVRFKNFDGTGTKKVQDCAVLGLSFSYSDYNQLSVSLGNGVTFGMTREQVEAIMGTPKDEYVDDETDYQSLTYERDDEVYTNAVELTFNDGVLTDISIENYD